MNKSSALLFLAAGMSLILGCGTPDAEPGTPETPAAASSVADSSADPPAAAPGAAVSSVDRFWDHLQALCGNAYAGSMTSADAADSELAEQAMTMHVRHCTEDRLEVPFHIGENRSRTWLLTRVEGELQLQHDHRHEDGSEDTVTLYGGRTESSAGASDPSAAESGGAVVVYFPADEYSKELFETNGLEASVANTWSMEIVPGERFSYILRRPERYFQADFDLGQTVDPPPAPWGYE